MKLPHYPILVVWMVTVAWPLAGQEALPKVDASEVVPHPDQLTFPDLQFTPPDRRTHRHVLPCGVVAYIVEDRELPLVDVSILIRAGSYLDPDGKEGLASLTAGQLRAGGTAKQSPEEFDEELAFLAAELASSAGDTDGSVGFNCLTKDLDRVLNLFFDMLKTPRFDPSRLDLAKGQVEQELARRNDSTQSIESREWARLLHGREHYGFDGRTGESVGSILRDDLVTFHRKYYHPANFVIAASGDVGTEELLDALNRNLVTWSPANDAVKTSRPSPPDHDGVPGLYFVDKPDVNQGRVTLGHRSVTRDTPDFHAIRIMDGILGAGGFTSRIMSRVRSDKGLAYSAGSRYEFGTYSPESFRAFFQTKSETVFEAIATVIEEIDGIRAKGVTQDEVDTTVNSNLGMFTRYFSNSRSIAQTFAQDELTERPYEFWPSYQSKLRAVTPDDVRRVAEKYLHPDRLVVLIVGSAKDILDSASAKDRVLVDRLAGEEGVRRIPLPDPLTLEYPDAEK